MLYRFLGTFMLNSFSHIIFFQQEERNVDSWSWVAGEPLQPLLKTFAIMASGDAHRPASQANNPPISNNCQPTTSRGGLGTPSGSHDIYPPPYDWQVTKTTLCERGQQLLETGQWSDCKFIVGTEPHQQVSTKQCVFFPHYFYLFFSFTKTYKLRLLKFCIFRLLRGTKFF